MSSKTNERKLYTCKRCGHRWFARQQTAPVRCGNRKCQSPFWDRAKSETLQPGARLIEEVLADLAKEVPEAEWAKLPNDLTDNLDHYLYGIPKR